MWSTPEHSVSSVSCWITRILCLRYVLTAPPHPPLCSTSVLVRDGGVPSLSSTADIICTIEDENDHAPEFIVLHHDIEILENRDPEVVYTVLAFDMDAGNNGAVTYHIAGEYWRTSVLSGYWPVMQMVWCLMCWCLLHFPTKPTLQLPCSWASASAHSHSGPSKFSKVVVLKAHLILCQH